MSGAPVELAAHTTLRVGGPARRCLEARTEQEFVRSVQECDARSEPVLVVGGGSNLLVSDDGFPGTAVLVGTRGIDVLAEGPDGVTVRAAAGEDWDAFVAHGVEQGWVGLETLSGIPGRVGATPMQNVGAYGSEVSHTITEVRTWDRQQQRFDTIPGAECGFDYRSSRFKREPGRHLITAVTFRLARGELSVPIAYPELAGRLGIAVGESAPLPEVRRAVLGIRAGKGMVLDEADHDTWSGGSFFTNPILSQEQAARLPEAAPRFAAGGGTKTSAAWLIQNAGFEKGYGNRRAALSTKHVLALTNRGRARAVDLVNLARGVRDGVEARFGIRLVPEVNLVGVSLDDAP